jgi:hypothetical protein
MGTKRTGATLRVSKLPSGSLVITRRSCRISPTGRTILPPTLTWSRRGWGILEGAAVTMMPSNGAFSGHPL